MYRYRWCFSKKWKDRRCYVTGLQTRLILYEIEFSDQRVNKKERYRR